MSSNQKNALAVIEEKLTSKEVTQRLAVTLNLDPQDEKAQKEAYKYASSVLAEVKKTQGAEYGDLTKCTPDSICMSMIDAAQFRIAIDGRKLAHLESRWDKNVKANVATLQIDTNGFVAKIKEQYPDAVFSITPVFQGDSLKISGTDGQKTFTHESKDPFAGVDKLTGIVVSITYTNQGGEKIRDVQTISAADLKAIQAKGKGLAWRDFTLERMKTAALKRACKWHFRQNTTLDLLIDYDNKQNYDLTAPAAPVRKTIVDNINASVSGESDGGELVEDEPETGGGEQPEKNGPIDDGEAIDVDFEHEDGESDGGDPEALQRLLNAGEKASKAGFHSYKEWVGGLSDDEKDLVRDKHKGWQEQAREISKAEKAKESEATNEEGPPI